MNLTNRQVQALVTEFSNRKQIESENKKALNELKNQPSIKKEAERIVKLCKQLPDWLISSYSRYSPLTVPVITTALAEKEFKPKKYLDRNEIEHKIIIASIDSKDLDELKKRIKL